MAWRVYSLHAGTWRTAHPDTSAPGSPVRCGGGLWSLGLGETASHTSGRSCESLTHGPLATLGDDEEYDTCDCMMRQYKS